MLIDFNFLIQKYSLNINGVIHAGAHHGQEYIYYKQNNINDIIFFEPVQSTFKVLQDNLKNDQNVICVNKALGSENKKTLIYTTPQHDGQSSSILEPHLHTQQYPNIKFTSQEEIEVIKLDDYMKENALGNNFNLLTMDVQGYELEILKGSTKTLEHVDYIYTEINTNYLYKNCVLVGELDEFLSKFNFRRVETNLTHVTWGDAFYLKTI